MIYAPVAGPIADHVMGQAIDWHLRQATMAEGDWIAFVDWLEADQANARAYDRVAADDRAMPAIAAPLAPPAVRPLLPRRWAFGVGGTAIAASLVALLVPAMLPRAAMPYSVETRPGEQRTIALSDGTRIDLGRRFAPGSIWTRRKPRSRHAGIGRGGVPCAA